jgi:hypothetical protein
MMARRRAALRSSSLSVTRVSLVIRDPDVNNVPDDAALGPATRTLGDPQVHQAHRTAENINVFDFELSADEITPIDGLDTGRRGGPEPDAITLETFGREIPET